MSFIYSNQNVFIATIKQYNQTKTYNSKKNKENYFLQYSSAKNI